MNLNGHPQTFYYLSSGNVADVALTVRGKEKQSKESTEENQRTGTSNHPSK